MSSKPLSNQRVLITRAQQQAGTMAAALRELGAEVIEVPCIAIRQPRSYAPFHNAVRRLGQYEWLVLTSVNGVQAMFGQMGKLGVGREALAHLSIVAIGPATRKEMEKRGLAVAVMPKEYVAESVVEALRDKVKDKRVLLVRAKVARDVIPDELRRAGAHVDVVEAYETVVPEISRKRLREVLADPALKPTAITFTSSSTVRNFVELLGGNQQPIAGVTLASIGPVTSATLRELGLAVDVEASEYTVPGLVNALAQHFSQHSS